jgi:hypothetical protein
MFVLGHGGQTRHPRSSRIRFSIILVHSLYTHTKSPFFLPSPKHPRAEKTPTTGPSGPQTSLDRTNDRTRRRTNEGDESDSDDATVVYRIVSYRIVVLWFPSFLRIRVGSFAIDDVDDVDERRAWSTDGRKGNIINETKRNGRACVIHSFVRRDLDVIRYC